MCQVRRTPFVTPIKMILAEVAARAGASVQVESVGFGATAAFFNGRVNSRLPLECPVRVAAKTARNPPSDTLIFSDGSPAGSAAGDLGGSGSWGRGGNVSDRLFGWPCFTLAAALDTEAISHGAGTSRMYS